MNSNSKRLFQYIGKQKKLIALGVLATLLMSFIDLFTGSMLKFLTNLIDKFTGSFADGALIDAKLPVKYALKHPITGVNVELFKTTLKGADEIFQGMLFLCLIFVALYFLLSLSNYLRRVFMNAATQRILKDFKADIYQKILKLPFSFFHQNKTGDVVSRITYDVTTLSEIIDLLIEVARASIYLLVFVPVMFVMSWELSLFTILYFPLAVLLIDFITRKIKVVSKKITDNVGDYTAYLEEKINRIKLVKGFRKEKDEFKQFDDLVEDNYRHNLGLIKLKFALNPGSDFLGMIVLSIVYVFYSYKMTNGQGGTLGDIVFFLYLVKTAYKPVKKVAEAWGRLHVALVSTKKIFYLMDQEEEETATVERPLNPVSYIEFDKVSFSYPDDKRKVLNDVSFRAEKGDVVGITGKTGSGKTTLLKLIPDFFCPTKGEIRFNGFDDLSQHHKRSIVAHLGTDSMMIDATLRENIEYSGHVMPESVIDDFLQFIGLNEREALNWVIGKDGINLSDGQKQKVAFLRAILSSPRILIMDEVFSSLDQEDIAFIINYCQQNLDILFIVSRKEQVLAYANKVVSL